MKNAFRFRIFNGEGYRLKQITTHIIIISMYIISFVADMTTLIIVLMSATSLGHGLPVSLASRATHPSTLLPISQLQQ